MRWFTLVLSLLLLSGSFGFSADTALAEDNFTINYSDVSIKEYLRFVSKITGINFIYQEDELNFNVSVISEDPITPENVLSTLVQVLRINGLSLLEQEGNLVIHKNPEVKQIAKLVLEGEKLDKKYPLVTKVFRLKEAPAEAVGAVVRPMLSNTAVLDVFESKNLLILTDVTSNVEKVSHLIENLDSSQTPISIEPFKAKYEDADVLMNLATKILAPITKGHPFLLVPQESTQTIFVVSTSPLIEKSISVLSTLDAEAKNPKGKTLKSDNVFIYKALHQSVTDIMQSLRSIGKNIHKSGYAERGLLETIENARAITESQTLLFTGDPTSLSKVKELLAVLDTPTSEEAANGSFFIYKPTYVSPSQIAKALSEVVESLNKSPAKDQELVDTLKNVRVVPSTQSVIFSGDPATFSKIKELLASIDNKDAAEKEGGNSFFVYQLQNVPEEVLASSLLKLGKSLSKQDAGDKNLIEAIESMKYLSDTNSILFTGSERAIHRLQELVPSFDQGFEKGAWKSSSQFLVYKPKYLSGKEIEEAIEEFVSNLKEAHLTDPEFLRSLASMHWVSKTQSLIFTGSPSSLQKVEGLLDSIDTTNSPSVPGLKRTFYIYQLQYIPKKNVEDYLRQVADNLKKKGLKEGDLVETLQTMKWIPESHSFMFLGTQTSLTKVKELLQEFDAPVENAFAAAKPKFFLYPLQNVSKDRLEAYLNQIGKNLNCSDIEQSELYRTIKCMRWISEANSFMFNGTEESLKRIQQLLSEFDNTSQKLAPERVTFILYPLQYVSYKQMNGYLTSLSKNLKKSGLGEQSLIEAISDRKWIEDSHSFMFSGTEATLQRLQKLLKEFDEPSEARLAQGYYLYKLVNVSGDDVEADLERFASNMKASGMGNTKIIQVIDNLKWIKETNSLLLTGDATAIDEVKALIAQYDIPNISGSLHNEFYLYKPKYLTPMQLQNSLKDIASNLKKGGLADPSLLDAINSMKFSSETDSVIFTGNSPSLLKIEGLLKEIDTPTKGNASSEKSGFLLYKLKFISGPQMIGYLQDVSVDLKKSKSSEQSFVEALSSVRFVSETNSLIFTGPDPVLARIKNLVEKFDIPSLSEGEERSLPSTFFIYKPVYVSGTNLEKMLQEFIENLKDQSLYNPGLYHAIHTMKWVESTKSLIFTGDKDTIVQIKEILQLFDTPQDGTLATDGTIQPIDDTSFLVYKLQYHKGTEIQSALKQIAKDLEASGGQVNKRLLFAIQSIQWLEVTNSLLCTGDPETLTRLKELIKNLDIPLKQVLIEVLVIETSLSNLLSFGLDWGSNFKYKDKFAGKVNNSSARGGSFFDNFDTVNATTKATPTLIPTLQESFEVGVIGDIILHKGQSFISMGSLLRALQNDTEISIVMTPKILTQDNKQSRIFIGQNIPYAGSFVRNQGQTTVTNQNLEYRDIGMDLTITPVLGNSDIVTLDIQLNSSSLATDASGQTATTTIVNNQGVQGITTNKTNMNTTVHVPSQSFLVLSGMVNNRKVKNREGIPCLGGLPLIGAAFSVDNDTETKSNVVIFIRPHIISSYEDVKRVTEEQEDIFREQAGTPNLENQFEEGMELIKGINDD